MPLELKASDLDRRVTILRAGAGSSDSWGEDAPGADVEVERAAAVKPAPGTERFANAANAASAPMHFFLRWEPDLVRPTDRIRFGGLIYDVIAPAEEIGRQQWLRVQAVARIG